MNDLSNPLVGVFYHVTPACNRDGIEEHGIMPLTVTQTGKKRSYAVRGDMLQWAIEHVKERHGITSDLVLVCIVPRSQYWTCYNRDIWYTERVIRPSVILSADKLTTIIK